MENERRVYVQQQCGGVVRPFMFRNGERDMRRRGAILLLVSAFFLCSAYTRGSEKTTITRSNRLQADNKRVDVGVRGVNRHQAEQSRDMVGGKISVMVALRVAMCILVHFSYACFALRRYIICRCSSSRANMGHWRVLVTGGEPEIDGDGADNPHALFAFHEEHCSHRVTAIWEKRLPEVCNGGPLLFGRCKKNPSVPNDLWLFRISPLLPFAPIFF